MGVSPIFPVRSISANGGIRVRRGAFTLVELLVVITIIGILVGMLTPAVQSAREAARRTQCANYLSQWSKACLQHEEANGYYPSGGWGSRWEGEPARGFGANQPGGWLYNCLPYIDQGPLHDLAATAQGMGKMVGTPLPFANCPTRRRPTSTTTVNLPYNYGGLTSAQMPTSARTDYCINVGDGADPQDSGNRPNGGKGPTSYPATTVKAPFDPTVYTDCTGISFECSEVTQAHIKDGVSNTILLGEKYMDPDDYYNASATASDNENMYVGMDNDIGRVTSSPPMQDRSGYANDNIFGSAHVNSCNFIFCDGSLHVLSYSIDPTAFKYLGNRADGNTVDASKL